jgi:hypothetical protein
MASEPPSASTSRSLPLIVDVTSDQQIHGVQTPVAEGSHPRSPIRPQFRWCHDQFEPRSGEIIEPGVQNPRSRGFECLIVHLDVQKFSLVMCIDPYGAPGAPASQQQASPERCSSFNEPARFRVSRGQRASPGRRDGLQHGKLPSEARSQGSCETGREAASRLRTNPRARDRSSR